MTAVHSALISVPMGPAPVVDDGDRPVTAAPPTTQLTETVRLAAAGDRLAWERLVERFAPTVWAIARAHRLNAADAADVSQTTWVRLVENLHRIEQPERVGAWLATTARRESLRLLRLSGRQIPRSDDMESVADPSPSSGFESSLVACQRVQVIAGLVDRLPLRSGMLLRLLSSDPPLSYKDISETLQMPIGSIGPTRARALEQLRRLAAASGVVLEDLLP